MITLQFFKKFSKNIRSTKIPNLVNNSNKVQFLVLLKEKTSIKNPVFVINSNVNGQTQLNLHLYNYVYWEEIGRFYFINDIVQVNEQIYEVHCINDVLGTCRNIILNSTQFVVYAEKDIDDDIIDTRQIPATTPIVKTNSGINVLPNSNTCTVANIISEDGITSIISGGISQYIFDTLGAFSNFLSKSFHMYDNSEIDLAFKLYMSGTTTDSVLKATVFPYTPELAGRKSAWIGAYDTGIEVAYTLQRSFTRSQTLFIPWHDDKKRYRCSTYYKAQLYLPFVGVIGLDISDISGADEIGVSYVFDNVNASYLCTVTINAIQRYIFEGNVGSQIQFSTITNNPVQGYMDIASGVGSLLKGNLAGALGNVVEGVGKFTRADTTVTGDYNTNISTVYTSLKPSITLFYYPPQATDLPEFRGNMFCHKTRLLNLKGGYVQTENACFNDTSTSMFSEDLENVCKYLDTGIFLE